ncbi:MAG: ABC transporter ATP-binding protein [Chitinophagaceae bacterium]
MKPVIEIKQLGKKYRIRSNESYLALRDVISNGVKNIFKPRHEKKEDFWALEDINLQIEQGERIGIIGKNGAGKSTLLKILSRVTWPTTGEAVIRGRLASLLEVGTGFHPELTGRENIYLNGSILGLKKNEISRQFDAIVDFSGVEKFLDTPLKHYSSGMQLRLAFAVAAHLNPEILLVDEVLAVGDWEFQKKCLGKMEEVSKTQGRTILFVSHNIEAVIRLCNNAILLEHGKVKLADTVANVTREYFKNEFGSNAKRRWDIEQDAPGTEEIKLEEVFVHDPDYNAIEIFDTTSLIGITFLFNVKNTLEPFTHGISLFDAYGNNVFNAHDVSSELCLLNRAPGKYQVTAWIPENLLAEGSYTVHVAAMEVTGTNQIYFHEPDCIAFNIVDSISGNSARGKYTGPFPGIIRPKLVWQSKKFE